MTVPVIVPVATESTPPKPVAPVGRRWSPTTPLTYLLAVVVAVFTIAPVVYVAIGGFRSTGQLAADPLALPSPWEWGNYTGILGSADFWRQVFNSVLIAGTVTALVVLTGALAAFALSRYDFRGREGIYNFFTLGLLFPAGVAILPLYLLMRNLDLLDTPWSVALPEAAFGLPLTIVILRPFMRNIPSELEDAAVIDGCSRFGFFWRILLPLSGPALTTVASSPSWPAGTPTCCRCCCSATRLSTRCRWARRCSTRSTTPTPQGCWRSPRCRCCRRWCSSWSCNGGSSEG